MYASIYTEVALIKSWTLVSTHPGERKQSTKNDYGAFDAQNWDLSWLVVKYVIELWNGAGHEIILAGKAVCTLLRHNYPIVAYTAYAI